MGGIFGFLLSPLLLILEVIFAVKYWSIVLYEMITNDRIFDFLDKNDFSLQRTRFRLVKKDFIRPDHPLYTYSNDTVTTMTKIKETVTKDYVQGLTKIIDESSKFDIQNYISIIADAYVKMYRFNGDIYFYKIYEVYIQYWRLKIIERYFINTFIITIAVVLFLLIYFTLLK